MSATVPTGLDLEAPELTLETIDEFDESPDELVRRVRGERRRVQLASVGTEAMRWVAGAGESGGVEQPAARFRLPAIQWAVVYGVVLTMARALGEFGAVAIVSGGLAGRTQTMTQYVQSAYENGANETGAYAASVVLAAIAILTLVVMTFIGHRED